MDSYIGARAVLNSNEGNVISRSITLNNGTRMPIIGFGTFRINDRGVIFKTLDIALKAGYRLIDTAAVYGNEHIIGEALKVLLPKHDLKREDVFLTSKLAPRDQGAGVAKAVQTSLRQLNTSYIDLYLIHWPGSSNLNVSDPKNSELRLQSWIELEKLHNNGKGILKSIGVSNYTSKHISELLKVCSVHPAVNQIEFHPYYQQTEDLYKVCAAANIFLQAYSSLGGSSSGGELLKDSTIVNISKQIKKTTSQVLLRWALQCGYGVIPKSTSEGRIIENSQLDFIIGENDYIMIKNISFRHENKYAWEPETVK